MKKKGWFFSSAFLIIFVVVVLTYSAEAKDLYKILGVDKNASQREVQKAFHRLSLKYHPDKNPSKSAQAKFAEINNAYEVLSDEEKRKNYDLFGDEQGGARGPEPNPHTHNGGFHKTDGGGGWSNFGYDNSGHRFEQHSYGFGGEGGSQGQGNTFSFDFGGQGGSSFFGFGGNASPFQNIFDSFFGAATKGKEGQGPRFTSHNEGNTKSSKERKGSQGGAHTSSSVVEELNLKSFHKKVLDRLDTWAILFVPRASQEVQQKLQLLEQISRSLGGSIKVGYVDCEAQKQLCEEQNMWPMKNLKLRLYSLRRNGKLSALDYTGEWAAADVKSYCIDVLPKLSKHIEDVGLLRDEIEMEESSPIAVLFTKKKDTPAIWRALSGLFYGRIVFFDVQVRDDVDAIAKKLQVDSLPAIVGIYANGETEVLSKGEHVSSSIEEVKALLEDFERKSKAAGSKKGKSEADGGVPSLTKKNFESVCSQDTPLCVIGIHKSSRGGNKLRQILKEISQKSLVRKGRSANTSKNPVSYSVLDATKQLSFLNAFDESVSGSENLVLIAYKPKKGTYVFYDGPLNLENAENFVVEVLGGDVQLRRVIQDPVLV